jgi:hypothetical protein
MKFGDWRAALLVAVLVLGTLWAWLAAGTPSPLGPDAPAAVFSAGRAMVDDRAMAAKPHPIGSAEAGLVRSFLLQRMQALGLEPRAQEGVAVEEPRWVKGVAVGARVENLIGVLKGSDPSLPAVLLMAHSDSVPGSPGAADDAAGVASAFEVIRAFKEQGPHKRDVAVLITDGEEAGLLGARAFFASGDPLLKHIGEVVNLEARGGGGRVNMFQMADRDGGHMALFAKAVGDTNANSLTSEVYKYMPNDTDFTVSKQAGFPGYNFAFIGWEFDYHSPSSTPAALDQGSLQHMGDQALAVTRALADAQTLPGKGPDAAYSDVLGRGVLAYPAVLGGWALLVVSVLLAGAATWRGQQLEGARPLRPGPMVWGAVGALLIVAILTGILWAAAQLSGLGDFERHRALLAQYPLFLSGFALLTIGGGLFLVGPVQRGHAWTLLVGKAETRWSAWAGVFLLLALLSLVMQLRFPPMAMLAEWPLFAAAVLMAGVAFLGGGRFEAPASLAVAGVIGVLTMAHLGHFADQTFTAVGEMAPEILALFVLLALPVLFPLLTRWGRLGVAGQIAALVTLIIGGAVLAYASLHQPWSARTPRYVQAFYLQDTVSGKSFRASGLDRLDPWSAGVLSAGQAKPVRQDIPALGGKFWLSPAPDAGGQRAKFTSSRDGDAVVVHLAPQAGGRELRLILNATSTARDVTLEGQRANLLTKAGTPFRIRWSAVGEGLTLRFVPDAPHGELDIHYAEVKDGWPEGHRPGAKPTATMPFGLSDTTVITDELKTKW